MAPVDRLAEPSYMDINRPLIDVNIRAPDAIEQLFAREDPPRSFHEEFEQAVFRRPQIDRTAIARDALLFAIEFDVADAQYGRDTLGVCAAQKSPHTGQQFRNREWLDDVVIGAGGKAAHFFALLAAPGQHDDRQLPRFRPRTQTPA